MSNNLTIEQIQTVIDRGGCLVSNNNEIHYGAMSIGRKVGLVVLHFQFSKYPIANTKNEPLVDRIYCIDSCDWREATPEEIETHVPVEYRPKQETFPKLDIIIMAKFIGTDSLGYEYGKKYTLKVSEVKGISVTRIDGTGKCPYQSLSAFLKNWDKFELVRDWDSDKERKNLN